MDATSFGGILRTYRERIGLSQSALADRAGLSVRALRELESDRVARPRAPSVDRLAAALALSGTDRAALLAALGPAAGAATGRLRVEVLGPLVVRRSGVAVGLESALQRTLLGLLALHPQQVVPVTEIVDTLWGTEPPQSSVRLVHLYVAQLRQLLEPARAARTPSRMVRRSQGGYRLDLAPGELDLAEFDDLVQRAGAGRAAGDPDTAMDLLARALAGWRGPVLADLGDRLADHPAVSATNRRRVTAGLAFADLALDHGRHHDVLDLLRPLAAAEPLHEGLVARLMVASAGAGEKAAALRLFETIRARLGTELGVEPGAELRAAHLTVVREHISIPAGVGAGPVPAQLPADVTAFTGRDEHLKELDTLLPGVAGSRGVAAAVVSAIGGTAGVGKTALAVHWAHRVRDRFPDGQLYINLRGFDHDAAPLAPTEAVRSFLDALGVPPERIPVDLAARVGLYRSLVDRRRMLVLLDNARDAEQVRPLLPGAPGCLALVTSRHRLTSLVAAEGAHPVMLDLLGAQESLEFLARRLGAERITVERVAAEEIVERCAQLPLALAIAAARAAIDPRLGLATLAGELNDTREGLDALDAGDASTRIRAVFSWSLRNLSPAAARLFRLLGLHPGPDCSAPAAASLAGLTPQQLRPLVRELLDANLLNEPSPGRYTCHDLLRGYAADLAQRDEPAADRHAATQRMIDHYLHTAHPATRTMNAHRSPLPLPPPAPGVTTERPATHDDALAWFTTERLALPAILGRAVEAGLDRHVWHLAWAMEDFLDWRGYWPEWEHTLHTALAAAVRLDDADLQARSHQNLGGLYSRSGRYEEAERHLRRALTLFTSLDHEVGEAYVLSTLGSLYSRLGRHDDALSHSMDSHERFMRVGDIAGQASALNAVGWHHIQLGSYREAIRYCERAVALQREVGDRYELANTLDTIAFAHHHLAEYRSAMHWYQRAIDLFREVGDRWGEANAQDRLGDTHEAAGNASRAKQCWRTALEILEQLGDSTADDVRAKLQERR